MKNLHIITHLYAPVRPVTHLHTPMTSKTEAKAEREICWCILITENTTPLSDTEKFSVVASIAKNILKKKERLTILSGRELAYILKLFKKKVPDIAFLAISPSSRATGGGAKAWELFLLGLGKKKIDLPAADPGQYIVLDSRPVLAGAEPAPVLLAC
jgi:hypothetical protein